MEIAATTGTKVVDEAGEKGAMHNLYATKAAKKKIHVDNRLGKLQRGAVTQHKGPQQKGR